MGEAKRRGNFEERKLQSQQKQKIKQEEKLKLGKRKKELTSIPQHKRRISTTKSLLAIAAISALASSVSVFKPK